MNKIKAVFAVFAVLFNMVLGSGIAHSAVSALITDLSVKDTANAANWSIRANIRVGDLQYGDRTITLTSVAAFVAGSDWIRTANDSKAYTTDPIVTFTVTQNADVYVAHDDKITTKPAWMSGWTDTGGDIISGSGTFSLYKKTYTANSVVSLGNNGSAGLYSMYTIIVKVTVVNQGNFTINPTTHAVQQNGIDVFPMGMFEISSYWVDPWRSTFGSTIDAINSLTNFDYSECGTGFGPDGLGYNLWQISVVPFYEANNVWYDTPARRYDQAKLLPYITSNNFFGFYIDETEVNPEADPDSWARTQTLYPLIKAKFPNKLVLVPYWGDFKRLSTVADVIQYEAYRHCSKHPTWYEGTLEEYIFITEAMLNEGMIADKSGATSLNSFPNKSIWIMWVAVGSQWRESSQYTWDPVTPQEMRVEAYWTITTDAKGLGYWGYRLGDWDNGKLRPESLSNYPIQTALYNNLAGEIKSLESIILLPTEAHSWGGPSVGVQNTRVTFSPNPVRHMSSWGYDLNYLSYNLKKSGNTYYLFVANKDSSALNNVVINITGLTGPMTAKVLGSSTLGYDAAGRTVPVSNGTFTDNFQGFAGRVYEIFSAAPSITNLSVKDTANAADWSVRTNIQTGDLEYGDQTYTFSSVPASIAGSAWIRTANDSKAYTTDPLVIFTVTQNADVYVAHDDRITTKPFWMSGWTDTGENIVDNTGSGKFSLYKKTYTANSSVSLGKNGNTKRSMYTIIVKIQ